MKCCLTAIFFSSLTSLCFSQRIVSKASAEYFANNIIKVTFTPSGTWHNENVSDAVILKPVANKKVKIESKEQEAGILIDGKITIAPFDSADFRGFSLVLQPDEKIFGGGERALPLNRRGYRLPLYNNPWYGYGEGADALNYSVPFITSSKGYGLFFDNPSKGFIDIGKTNPDVLEYGASSGEINVYMIFGDYQTILQSYYKLTGTQPLPPRWAFGNLMSRFGYTSDAQVKDIYAKMKAENIPVDAIIFDLFWFGDSIKHTLGNLDWMNKSKWPDPKKMIADFKKDGVKTILVTEPFFVETSKNYKASKPYLAVDSLGNPYYLNDFYFGNGGLIDIFRKDAQTWFWQFYKKQMQNGVEAWWGDLGEPERHPSNLYHNLKDLGYKRLFKADEVHNIYGHNWTKMLYNFYAKEYPNKRLFSLNRSGFAGTQRYSIFPWTGDVSRSWSGLRAQLPVLLGMSMSGVPYVHSDAGGFAGGEGDPELYVRWLQFAAFTPIFRPHGTALYEVDTAAFSFPSEAALMKEPYKSIAKNVIDLRYELLPYNYSLGYQQAKTGKPLISPLYYYHSDDTMAVRTEDEFMWGENILVAPVLKKGQTERAVYLPKGKWYNAIKNRMIDGGKTIIDSVTIETFPVFIKEGGFVPFATKGKNAGTYDGKTLFMVYVPSASPSSFEMYSDDGTSKNSMVTKHYELISFQTTGRKENDLAIKVSSNGGRYEGKPASRNLQFILPQIGKSPRKVIVNNKPLIKVSPGMTDVKTGTWFNSEKEIIFAINFIGAPVNIEVQW